MKKLRLISLRTLRSCRLKPTRFMLALSGILALGGTARADSPIPSAVVIANFEKFHEPPMGAMFQSPFCSSTTTHYLSAAHVVQVTEQFPDGNPRTEKKALLVKWTFKTDAVKPWLRLTTFNAPELPNPTIDCGARLRFDVYPNHDLGVAVAVRETNTSAPWGEDGGTDGNIEYAGVLAVDHGVPICQRRLNANEWTTVEINFPAENIVSFTGNDILDAGKGVLESLILIGSDDADRDFQVYLDNFVVVPNSPSPDSATTEITPVLNPVLSETETEDITNACLVEAGDITVLQWRAEANRRYHIFRKEISPASTWINLGTEVSFDDQEGRFTIFQPSSRAFYRVMATSSHQAVYLTQIPPTNDISSLRLQP